MKCPGCGEENPDGYMYCISCGVGLSGIPSKQESDVRKFFDADRHQDAQAREKKEKSEESPQHTPSAETAATNRTRVKSHGKRNAGIVMGVVVVVVVIVLAVVFQGAPTVPSGYLVYKNQAPAWSIDYPNSWNSSETGNSTVGEVAFNGTADMAVIVAWYAGLSLSTGSSNTLAFIDNQSSGYHLISMTNSTVDGLPAVVLKTYSFYNGTNYTENEIMVANASYFFSILWGGDVANYQAAYSQASEAANTFKIGP